MSIKELLRAEETTINRMFQQNSIYAKVNPAQSVFSDPTAGFIRYALTLRADQRFDAIERMQRELSAVLSAKRAKVNLPSPIQAIPVSVPSFALEVPHPAPQVLLWSPRKVTTTPAHTMLLGRSYSGKESTDETISLADSNSCHALIVGITGAGKSVLLQNMLLSLSANTSPAELKLVIVDLKNEDMLPFRQLPHVLTFAGTKEQAIDAIRFVYAEKEKRVAQEGYKPYRLVLWIDELAQLAAMKDVAEMLGDLASIGRGKLINLVGATQHPTEKGGLGGLLKANFPVRLVGMVAPGQSYVATGRPKIHADLLPGKGAFLRIQGPQVQRFQSFNIEAHDVKLMADYVAKQWQAGHEPPVMTNAPLAPVQTKDPLSLVYESAAPPVAPVRTSVAPIVAPPLHQLFPLSEKRPLSIKEAAEVWRLSETMSKNKLCELVYGSKSARYMDWINDAVSRSQDGKIIPFPKRTAS